MSKESDGTVISHSLPSLDGLAGNVLVCKEIISRREAEIEQLNRVIDSSKNQCRDAISSVRATELAHRAALKKQISNSEKREQERITQIELAYSAYQDPLVHQVKDIQALVKRDKERIAPIRKLPAELLSAAFNHHVEMGESPWVLTLVSRSWKQTAETTPRLWTNILIRDLADARKHYGRGLRRWEIDGKGRFSYGDMVVCCGVEELELVVSRAGSLSLTLSIFLDSCQQDIAQAVLYDPTFTARIVSLDITGQNKKAVEENDGRPFGPFPGLVNLHLSSMRQKLSHIVLTGVSQTASQLQQFAISETAISPTSQYTFWSNLKTLDLSRNASSSLLNIVLPQLKQIETLKGCPYGWPNNETPPTTLLGITSLQVSCHLEHFHRLDLPALEDLSLFDRRWGAESQLVTTNETAINLPVLRRLKIDISNKVSWFPVFNAPLLHHLDYEVDSGNERALDRLYFPTVDEVIIRGLPTDASTIHAFESVPNARTILIDPRLTADKMWIRLFQHLADTRVTICPKLASFTIGAIDHGIRSNRVTAKPLIRKFINDRSELGKRTDVFKVYWKGRGKNVDEIDFA